MSGFDHIHTLRAVFDHRGGQYGNLWIRAGRPKITHVVPPAGEAHSFDRKDYPVNVEVTVSPTGRSVQVWVNGNRVYPKADQ